MRMRTSSKVLRPELSIRVVGVRVSGDKPERGGRPVKQYLLSIYQPDGPAPEPEVLGPIMADLAVWNDDLRAADAWVFGAGLFPPSTATVVRAKSDEVLTTDGPFVEAKEHIG